nr:MAG TPA: hypothetical protein [Caudoviricetes sp.]
MPRQQFVETWLFLWEWLVGLPFYHDKAREPDGGRDRITRRLN